MASILVALNGCSNRLETDLAECKAKAAPATSGEMSGEKWSDFIRECMRDEGWTLRDACLEKLTSHPRMLSQVDHRANGFTTSFCSPDSGL
jgi:hypothetical protein